MMRTPNIAAVGFGRLPLGGASVSHQCNTEPLLPLFDVCRGDHPIGSGRAGGDWSAMLCRNSGRI